MIHRRQFTFAGLALALSGTARAGGRPAPQQQAQRVVPPAPRVRPEFTATRKGDELHLELDLVNVSDAPLELLVGLGSRPGPAVEVFLEIEDERIELARIMGGDRREIISRAGPIPRFEPAAPRASLAAGTYRFALPPGMVETEVVVRTHVTTGEGESLRDERKVSWAKGETRS